MSKITLHLKQRDHPFASCPAIVELEPERIKCNDITLPGDFNPHNTRLWVIGNEYGAMGAVWAQHEQDAIDELIDQDLAGGILIDEEREKELIADGEDISRGGNAGEAYESDHLWMAPVVFEAARDLNLLLKFAEARGAGHDNLDY
jgi:hypothetical protein